MFYYQSARWIHTVVVNGTFANLQAWSTNLKTTEYVFTHAVVHLISIFLRDRIPTNLQILQTLRPSNTKTWSLTAGRLVERFDASAVPLAVSGRPKYASTYGMPWIRRHRDDCMRTSYYLSFINQVLSRAFCKSFSADARQLVKSYKLQILAAAFRRWLKNTTWMARLNQYANRWKLLLTRVPNEQLIRQNHKTVNLNVTPYVRDGKLMPYKGLSAAVYIKRIQFKWTHVKNGTSFSFDTQTVHSNMV